MFSYFLRILVIFLLTLLCLTAGCENGFKKKIVPGSYSYQQKKFKEMVENDPFPSAGAVNSSI